MAVDIEVIGGKEVSTSDFIAELRARGIEVEFPTDFELLAANGPISFSASLGKKNKFFAGCSEVLSNIHTSIFFSGIWLNSSKASINRRVSHLNQLVEDLKEKDAAQVLIDTLMTQAADIQSENYHDIVKQRLISECEEEIELMPETSAAARQILDEIKSNKWIFSEPRITFQPASNWLDVSLALAFAATLANLSGATLSDGRGTKLSGHFGFEDLAEMRERTGVAFINS